MASKLISILLSLALLLGLVGCAGTSSVSQVRPTSVSSDDPEQAEETVRSEEGPLTGAEAAALPDAASDVKPAAQASELPEFSADFAASKSVILSAFQAALQRQQQADQAPAPQPDLEAQLSGSPESSLYSRSEDTQAALMQPETSGEVQSPYTLAPDTAPLLPEVSPEAAVALEGDLACRLDGGLVRISLGTVEVARLTPELLLEDPTYVPRQLLLADGILAALLESSQGTTLALLYDLSEPSAPRLLGSCGLDGELCQARLRDGVLLLCTDYAPQAEALTLPAFYEETRRTELQPSQILMPESLEEPVFLVCARFEVASAQCLDCIAAAGTSQAVTVLTDGRLLFSWAGAEAEQEVTTQSVYTVTTTVTQTKAGLALVALEDQRWSVLAACEVRGIPQLAALDGNGSLGVVSLVTDTQKEIYYDPSYGWTVEPEQTREERCLLYLLDEDLTCLGRLELAQEAPTLLGLYDNTLYYITPSDGILRAAGTSDAAQPIAAPLAEVGSFADFAILKEGCAVGLAPAEEEGLLELVVLNISNPSRITRKYLSEPWFSSDTRLVSCQVAGQEGSLIALQEEDTLWLLQCSSVFAPTVEASLPLTFGVSQVLGSEHLLCLSGSAGSLLLDLSELADSPS